MCLLLAIALLAVAPGLAQEPPPPPASTSDIVPGEILVKFQPHVSLLGARGSLQSEGLRAVDAQSRSGVLRVEVEPGREAETIARLLARGDVEFATQNHVITAAGDPNDPFFSFQWALKQTSDIDIDATDAWDTYAGGSNITIAVIDSGVDLDHPDLQASIVPGYDFVNDDNMPDDDNSHGTHVAGIAAAVGNNGIGIAGVSWRASIMPLKILNAGGVGNTFDMADAVHYAVDNGAQVINLSVGAQGTKWPCNWPEVDDAFNYAVNNGVLLVVAAGNGGQSNINCPGAYDQTMAVGSTTSADQRSSFSNYGPRLDIAAPGSFIYSTFPGGYGYNSGTSMATPHVAGLAALLWSLAPSLTDDQIRDLIQNTADDLGSTGWDQFFGYGRINAGRAMAAIGPHPPPQLTLFIDDDSGPASSQLLITTTNPDVISWTVSMSPDVPWLDLDPPTSGALSAASSPAGIVLHASYPASYDTYTTTLVLTGTAVSGETIGPKTTKVVLYYLPEFYEYILPLVSKN